MSYRIFPAWWPIIGLSSPVLFPMLFVKNRRYKRNIETSQKVNKERMARAKPLEMPQLNPPFLSLCLRSGFELHYMV
jgi:7,8-dihydropterin-6-yl-methyl-4-(beta-D-ribofuranosyl)aminobenzene 5'-phosphate synthase